MFDNNLLNNIQMQPELLKNLITMTLSETGNPHSVAAAAALPDGWSFCVEATLSLALSRPLLVSRPLLPPFLFSGSCPAPSLLLLSCFSSACCCYSCCLPA